MGFSGALRLLAGVSLLLRASSAIAAGGADVVDDSAPETPGVCHLESHFAVGGNSSHELAFAPACTFTALPQLEIGALLLRSVVAGSGSTTYGPAAKLNLRDERLGLGIGLIGQANVNTDGKLESGALILPVTIPAGSVLRRNTNVGWLYNRSGERDQFFSGSQLEMTVTGELNVMAECFDRNPGKIGAQVRLRWTPRNANYDLDFLYGSYVNGAARHIVTLNLTLRS